MEWQRSPCGSAPVELTGNPRQLAAITNHHKFSRFREQQFVLSEFWRPKVGNQGVYNAMLPLTALGENTSLPLLALVAPGVHMDTSF